MKRVLIYILISTVCTLAGCKTVPSSTPGGPPTTVPDIRFISEIATGVALASRKEADRPAVAKEVYAVAAIINGLAGGDIANLQLAIQKELAGWNSPYRPWVQLLADAIIRNAANNPNKQQGLLDASQGAMDAAKMYE